MGCAKQNKDGPERAPSGNVDPGEPQSTTSAKSRQANRHEARSRSPSRFITATSSTQAGSSPSAITRLQAEESEPQVQEEVESKALQFDQANTLRAGLCASHYEVFEPYIMVSPPSNPRQHRAPSVRQDIEQLSGPAQVEGTADENKRAKAESRQHVQAQECDSEVKRRRTSDKGGLYVCFTMSSNAGVTQP